MKVSSEEGHCYRLHCDGWDLAGLSSAGHSNPAICHTDGRGLWPMPCEPQGGRSPDARWTGLQGERQQGRERQGGRLRRAGIHTDKIRSYRGPSSSRFSRFSAADRPRAHRARAVRERRVQNNLRDFSAEFADQRCLGRYDAKCGQCRVRRLRSDHGGRCGPHRPGTGDRRPSSSQIDCTGSLIGMLASDSRTPRPVARASSCATVARPPRVGSRMKRKPGHCHQSLRLR